MVCCFPECGGGQRPHHSVDSESHPRLEAAHEGAGGVVIDAGDCAEFPLHHLDISARLAFDERASPPTGRHDSFVRVRRITPEKFLF